MTRKERYDYALSYFRKNVGHVSTELNFGSAFQLLCATLLSAQCTDKRINAITPELFRHYPDAKTMATATSDEIFDYVKSVSYPNSKAKHLVEMSKMLVEKFGGEVPSDPNALITLPGVGRKTANVIQAVWFGKPTLAVDTHVYRVSHRLGLVPSTANTPRKVEDYLMKISLLRRLRMLIIGYYFMDVMSVRVRSPIVNIVPLMTCVPSYWRIVSCKKT